MTTYLLDDLAGFLAGYNAGALGLTIGVNLFKGLLPNTAGTTVALFEYPGSEPDYVMGAANPLPAVSHPRLQVLARDIAYSDGRSTVEQSVRALETIVNATINGTYYLRAARIQDPFLLHRDARRRTYFACNVDVEVTPS